MARRVSLQVQYGYGGELVYLATLRGTAEKIISDLIDMVKKDGRIIKSMTWED